MGKSKKLIVFDLDGTLNRTELYAVEIHRMVQTEFGWHAQCSGRRPANICRCFCRARMRRRSGVT